VAVSATILPDRGVVFLSGAAAGEFLQGLVTNEVAGLKPLEARHAALLSPQGKILVDFIVVATEDGYLLDAPRALTPDLVKKLTFYRLRKPVEIADMSESHVVAAVWGGPAELPGAIVAADPRLDGLGARAIPEREGAKAALAAMAAPATAEDYHAHRIALGVPEGGKDFAFGDTYPHEADMDQLNGVDFKKGCFVGQEVVARMQHKTVVRKRVTAVELPGVRPVDGVDVMAGGQVLGYMGTSNRDRGLAMLRLDKVADAIAAGAPLTAGGVELKPLKPAWARFDVPGAP
jgi:tRNA-modifying protein YgfZ